METWDLINNLLTFCLVLGEFQFAFKLSIMTDEANKRNDSKLEIAKVDL